jgi:alkyl hydroperoxide reductase subunit AhpC
VIEILTLDTPSLGNRSYLVSDGTVAVAVDVQRDIERVLDAADEAGVAITHVAETQGQSPNFPIVADSDGAVAALYGMVHPNVDDTATVRSVFVIGPDKKIKLTLTYPMSTGRNFAEILRVIDSLQLTANHKVSTPANWVQGGDVFIIPAVGDDEARQRFPDGWTARKPYLRVVGQPS